MHPTRNYLDILITKQIKNSIFTSQPMTSSTYSDETNIQKLLDKPMHCVGMYIATISLACALAMAADALHGFRNKKYWCPSKYFPLNAACLALLAVSLKLPMDLNAQIHAITDRLANISSIALMSVAMANSMTSLGNMSNKDILMNVSALAILVITVCFNVFMQIIQLRTFLHGRVAFVEEMVAIACMVLMLFMWCSLSLMLLSTKRYLKKKYCEMDRHVLSEENDMEMGRVVTNEKLRLMVTKYWVMAETSSPQFVIARSVICVSSGIISVIMAFVLVGALIRFGMKYPLLELCNSSYQWSTKWILLNQTIGVLVGIIAPVSRWFFAICFRYSNKGKETIESVFLIEGYWSRKMVEWKANPLCVQIPHLKIRKVLHGLRDRILEFCIFLQVMTILVSKLLLLVSVSFATPFLISLKENRVCDSDSSSPRLEVSNYVILLEGERELLKGTLRSILWRVDEAIQRGKTQRPKNLLKLLHKSCKFSGVLEFDSDQVPSLYGREPPYCWSLPIVTLASIAVALPNVDKSKSRILLDCVAEGHSLSKLIDKGLDINGDLKNIKNAANVVWVRVELYRKWQDNDLHKSSVKGKNSISVLLELASEAEKIVLEFKRDVKDRLMNNPLNWPAKIIAANSMYRICKTILLSYNGDDASDQTGESLFEQISVTIADLLSACLSNLAHLIMMKCQQDVVGKMEQSVCKAALLFGETEEIREHLQKRELPFLAHDKTVYVEEWRNHLSANSEIS